MFSEGGSSAKRVSKAHRQALANTAGRAWCGSGPGIRGEGGGIFHLLCRCPWRLPGCGFRPRLPQRCKFSPIMLSVLLCTS